MILIILITITALSILGILAIELISLLYPNDDFRKGKLAFIYIDKELNRTATITSYDGDELSIYRGLLKFDIHYHGRFYLISNTEDGHVVTIVSKRRYYRVARFIELFRKKNRNTEKQRQEAPISDDENYS